MTSMSKSSLSILFFCVGLTIGMLLSSAWRNHFTPDIDVGSKSDTIITRDTNIFINPPAINIEVSIEDNIIVPPSDIIMTKDSLIALPKSVKTYSGKSYKCQVSGYQPSLDWITIYPETKIIKEKVLDKRRNMLYVSGETVYTNRITTAAMLMYQRNWKYLSLRVGAGYEFINSNAMVMIGVQVPIFRW